MSNASKVALAAGAAAAAVGSWFLVSTSGGKPFLAPVYEAVRVIDGDTFVTQEGQYVRVASTEAPEPDRKTVYRDPYQRSVSFVYADGVFVNQAMLECGWSYYYRSSPGKIGEDLKATKVQLYLGDVWFCSEKEAIKAGFRKPEQCP